MALIYKEERELHCHLTEQEVARHSDMLASKMLEQREAEATLDSIKKDYKAKIEKIDAHINELLRKVSKKQELRTIMCEWSFNWPDGQKKLVRTDTGEVIAEDQIREHEQQRHFDDLKKEQEEAEAEKIAAGDPIPKSVVINGHLA